MVYDTSSFADSVRRDCYLPNAQKDFTDEIILQIADDEFINTIATFMVSLDENYYVEPYVGTFVVGQADYLFPKYAMWMKLRRVDIIIGGKIIQPLRRLTSDDIIYQSVDLTGTPTGFYANHDVVSFNPAPAAADQFKLLIYRRPGRMVPITIKDPQTGVVSGYNAAQVQSVNYLTGVVTYSTPIPASGFTSTSTHDFYSSDPPFQRLADNIQATAITPATQTFPVDSVQKLKKFDYVCRLDETVYPPIPLELQPLQRELVIRRLSKSQMDEAAYQLQRQEIIDRMGNVLNGPGNRVVGQPKSLNLMNNGLLMSNVFLRFP